MYTINIISAYSNPWTEQYNNKKDFKRAIKSLFENMAYGETLTAYNPAGAVLKQVTK